MDCDDGPDSRTQGRHPPHEPPPAAVHVGEDIRIAPSPRSTLHPPDRQNPDGSTMSVIVNSVTVNIVLELFDDVLLLADDRLHEVTDRDDADDLLVIENRQVAHGFRRHKAHTFLD